ncbi:50S ribosomal protein L24 [Candidatus Margulisiibacteriota bacterium]
MKRLKEKDTVEVITGKEAGKKGKVSYIDYDKNTCLIDGLNMAKKHMKQTQDSKGGIVDINLPINLSNVMYYCQKCKSRAKIGFAILKDGKKTRVCKKCKEDIE